MTRRGTAAPYWDGGGGGGHATSASTKTMTLMTLLLTFNLMTLPTTDAVLFRFGGTALHRNDDGYSSAQSIPNNMFKFFGQTQTQVFVCTNGILSFGSGVSSYSATPFPAGRGALVAPFWSDIDIRSSGNIYYGPISGGNLRRASTAVHASWTASWGFSCLWDAVPAYPGSPCCNTFEAVLLGDGTSSFVIFNFGGVSWTHGSASTTHAQLGFDAGNNVNYYAHPWSRTANAANFPSGNIGGTTGRYVWSVGSTVVVPITEVVIDPCADITCQNGGTCNDGDCSCRTGYEGNLCQTTIQWCSRNGITCSGGRGTCSNTGDNSGWQCSCDHPGWYGTQCEHTVDQCATNNIVCQHGGTCSNHNEDREWICTCTHAGYYGSHCHQITDWCTTENEDCSGHGTCANNVADDNRFWVCTCDHPGYYGTQCEHITDWCTTENEDCNGNGVCSNDVDYDNRYWKCTCDAGFEDNDCTWTWDWNDCDCDDQLCMGGTYCHNNGNCGPNGCECISPWAGEDCLTNNPACTGVDCGHGSCSGGGQCDCHTGYTQVSSTSICDAHQCGGFACYNGGTCVAGVCVCAVGFLGSECTTVDLCHGETCNGHGNCVVYQGTARCNCDDLTYRPTTGPIEDQCSQHECGNTYCYNGGECVNGACVCVYPYTGSTCTGTDYCSGIDCVHGTCSESGAGYVCTCESSNVWVDPLSGLCSTVICPSGTTFCRHSGTCISGSDACSCPAGYSGDNCEIWDPCHGVECLNGATCRDNTHNGGDFLCDCDYGYDGRYCGLQRCINQETCYNGGECLESGCLCPPEWTGSTCQEAVPNFCQSYYCGEGGTCSGTTSPICTCASGYQQAGPSDPCELICADLNCQNGGVCNSELPVCQCPPGYYGETCGLDSPCGSVECNQERGSCGDYQGDAASCMCILDIYTGDDCSTEICSGGPQSHCYNGGSCTGTGCECVYPYEGTDCTETNYCQNNFCENGACTETADGATCDCDDGYIADGHTGICNFRYPCDDGYTFCMNGGSCNAAGDGCDCPTLFSGDNCEIRDRCDGVDCSFHGECFIVFEEDSYECSCDDGWVGMHCEYHRCHNDVVCHNAADCGEAGCICLPGWTGVDCSSELDDACYDETSNFDCGHGDCVAGGICECDSGWTRAADGTCTYDVCGGITCQNGGTCTNGECDCPPNYYGDDCSDTECQDLDCGANGVCHRMNDGSNECICVDPRWSGTNCQIETCADNAQCQNGGSCVGGTTPCNCPVGYSGDNCETVDPCAGIVCSHGSCHVVDGAHFCRCDDGYVPDPDDGLCTQELCLDGNNFCRNDQPCATSSTCACSGAYSGTNCEIVDYCYQNDCNGHGECRLAVDSAGNSLRRHECVCEPGYHGSDCQYQYCTLDVTCFNGGVCTSEGCECTAEWQGPSCELPVAAACTAPCDHGECDDNGDCQCYEGYTTGPTGICDAHLPTDGGVCDTSDTTCYNGATCVTRTDLFTGVDEPHCVCTEGWTGDDCNTVDECSQYDCSGHGTCVMYQGTTPRCYCDDPNWEDSTGGNTDCDQAVCPDGSACQNGGTCLSDNTCVCPYPYYGATCSSEDVCMDNRCQHGTCTAGGTDFAWSCECDEGYIYNTITGMCDVMLCADHVVFCQNGGTCQDGATSSTCTCPAGTTGTNCETVDFCHDVDCHSGTCANHATHYECECLQGFTGTHCTLQHCINGTTCHNDGECGRFGCECTPEWEGPSCEIAREPTCYGVDCGHGQCVELFDGATNEYECQCHDGYTQSTPSDPCTTVECTTLNCANGGTCLGASGYDPERCDCMPGYLGDNCEIATCAQIECHNHGECVVLPNGGGQCICHDTRFTHTGGADAVPGDCALETQNDVTCQNGGSCVDHCNASPPCVCPWPYVGDNCETLDICSAEHDICGSGTCYTTERADGRHWCANDAAGCVAEFWCDCDDGFIPDFDTGVCTTALCDTHFCQNGGSCNADQLSCDCPAGTSGDYCENVDHCHERDCTGNGFCRVIDGTSYSCQCDDGWTGRDCELQRCTNDVTCFNGGSCTTTYGCECASGWGGPSCEIEYTLLCEETACVHGVCDDSSGSAVCNCDTNWGGDDCNTHQCTDDSGLACQNGGTCIDGDGDPTTSLYPEATCHCVPPYSGSDCSEIDDCAGNTCSLHGNCIHYPTADDDAMCVCDDERWTGDNCDVETCTVGGGQCNNGGSCLSDGTCACPFPYHGANCDEVDYCLGNPCMNGYCDENDAGDGFICTCYDDFTQGITGVCDTQWCVDNRFCLNGGTCINWSTYSSCECPPGITGAECETVDHCYNQDCSGHGLCENRVDGGGYTCICFDDFLGQDCSQQRCLNLTCQNGGVCGPEGCRCPVGWSGESCESAVDPNCWYTECGPHGDCHTDGREACDTLLGLSATYQVSSGSASDTFNPDTDDLAQYHITIFNSDSVVYQLQTISDHAVDDKVTEYTVEYSLDGTTWTYIRSEVDSSYYVFTNDQTLTIHTLANPVVAAQMRIKPLAWHLSIYMSVVWEGCEYRADGQCACDTGYSTTDTFCDTLDTCGHLGNCQNGGTCINGQCQCDVGYTGVNCESAQCINSDVNCYGNGRCELQDNGEPICVCDHQRYVNSDGAPAEGDCSVEICGYPAHDDLQCRNGGTCVVDNQYADSNSISYTCACPYPFTGSECETYEECSTNPCVHGTCYEDPVFGTESHCVCDAPYIRDPDTLLCTTEQCSDGHAFCYSGGECNANGNGCDCDPGYSGVNCENRDYCFENTCSGHGICNEVATGDTLDTATGYYCTCEDGYIGNDCERQRCNGGDTCFNGGTCDSVTGCVCPTGFGGPTCEYVYSDDCTLVTCYNNGYCDDVNYDTPTCVCPDNYQGDDCHEHTCDGGNRVCYNGGTCNDGDGDDPTISLTPYSSCDCIPPYGGDDCSTVVDDCSGVTCSGRGECRLYDGVSTCECAMDRYTGDNCENEACGADTCQNGGSCGAGNTCECVHPYFGDNCEQINWCQNDYCQNGECTVTGEVCDDLADGWIPTQLLNVVNTHQTTETVRLESVAVTSGCVFTLQYSMDGVNYQYVRASRFDRTTFSTESMDDNNPEMVFFPSPIVANWLTFTFESYTSDCGAVYGCAAVQTGVSCECEPGYIRGVTGLCDTQLCSGDGEATFCQNGGECDNYDTTARCLCQPGTTGEHCETVDFCETANCNAHARCVNQPHAQTYTCECIEPWIGDHCNMQRCMDGTSTCMNNGVCGAEGCRCPEEWTGLTCESPIDLDCQGLECGPGICVENVLDVCNPATSMTPTSMESVTSITYDAATAPDQAALTNTVGAFVAEDNSLDALDGLLLVYDDLILLENIVTRGNPAAEEWTRSYRFEYWSSANGVSGQWQCLEQGCIFEANNDQDTSVTVNVVTPITSTRFRITPLTFFTAPALRVELRGCDFVANGSCDCNDGYSSPGNPDFCGIEDTCGDVGACLNGATCEMGNCHCAPGYTGYNCEVSLCHDENVDCSGRGHCEILNDGNPHCVCNDARYSHSTDGPDAGDCAVETCEYPATDGLVCQNGASCVALDYLRGSFECECPYGYTGTFCETAVECSVNNCVHGTCHEDTVYLTDSHCECDDGWTHDPDTLLCTVNRCENAEAFCMHGGECNADGNGCDCPPNTSGDRCEDVNYCYENNCTGHGECFEVATGNTWDTATGYYCECVQGWHGDNCEHQSCIGEATCFNGGSCTTHGCACAEGFGGPTCEYVYSDDCIDLPCVFGYCDDSNYDTATCVCDTGYTGDDCNTHTCDSDGPDGVRECANGGTCVEDYGLPTEHLFTSSRCYCLPPWGGDTCEEQNDPCAYEDCSLHGSCIVLNGEAFCDCDDERWTGDHCERELCANDGGAGACYGGGSCVSGMPCACPYPLEGPQCELTNYCQDNHCVHGTCRVQSSVCGFDDVQTDLTTTTDGRDIEYNFFVPRRFVSMTYWVPDASFRMQYSMDGSHWVYVYQSSHVRATFTSDATTATFFEAFTAQFVKITVSDDMSSWDSATFEFDGCHADQTGFTCECDEGYYLGLENTCTTQLCDDARTRCLNSGVCLEDDTTSECTCPPGRSGENCQVVDQCYDQDCNNHGICENRIDGAGYTCHCFDGYVGQDCSMQRCLATGTTCRNGGTCGATGCRCTEEWTGESCEERVNPHCVGIACGTGTCTTDQAAVCTDTTATVHSTATGASLAEVETEVDLGSLFLIHGISAGINQASLGMSNAVHMQYKRDASQEDWVYVRSWQDSSYQLFNMINEDGTQVTTTIDPPILATQVRFLSSRWTLDDAGADLTIDYLGCAFTQEGTCDCPTPYVTNDNGTCVTEVCDENYNCENGGTCIEGYDGEATCQCRPGYTGRYCQESSCVGFNCHEHGRCVVLSNGEPSCVCDQSRWTHDTNLGADGYCSLEDCGNGLVCQHGGSCLPRPTDDTTVCVCPYPYTGSECETYEECSVNPCVNGECHVDLVFNTESHCECHDGWTLDPDTQLCTVERCTYSESFCMHGGACNAAGDGCDCPDGTTGTHCEQVDYCFGRHNCSGHGECVNVQTGVSYDTNTDYFCRCDNGWQGRECNQQRCSDDITCMNGGWCRYDGCQCADGWGGLSCEVPVPDECYNGPDGAYNCTSHGHCTYEDGQLGCECYDGFTTNPDDTRPSCNVQTDGDLTCYNGGTVGEVDGEPRCWCTDDWIGDDCSEMSPCRNFECGPNARCILDPNEGATCACAHSRWQGDQCLSEVCNDDSVCVNGGTCTAVPDSDSYTCTCPYPYTGSMCETEDYCQDLEMACGSHAIRCHEPEAENCDDLSTIYQIADHHVDDYTSGPDGPRFQPTNFRLNDAGPGHIVVTQLDVSFLDRRRAVHGVVIRGYEDDYITQFTVVLDGVTLMGPYSGASDGNETVTVMFDSPQVAERVSIRPLAQNGQAALRMDVLSCPYLEYTCDCHFDPNDVTGYVNNDVTGMCTTHTCSDGSTTCLNNGECQEESDGSTWCLCPEGVTGEFCETVDFCFRVECSNHGDCESRPQFNDHMCHCYEGWMGADCSMQLCTHGVTCMNNGVCGDLGCVCTPGWTGESCETEVTLRCQGAPRDANGVCVEDETDYTVTTTGCQCWFDDTRTDCACCVEGGSQCGADEPFRCVSDNDVEACEIPLERDTDENDSWQSTTEGDNGADHGNDGDPSTCTQTLTGTTINTHYNDWWTMNLGETLRVYKVAIITQDGTELNNFHVLLLADNHNPILANQGETCVTVTDAVPYNASGHEILCDSPAVGRYLSLYHTGNTDSLTFCDIQVIAEQPWRMECNHGYENQDGDRHASCDVQVCDFVSNRTCEHGGTCLANATCACPVGYQGEFCEYRTCADVDCYDHGRCEILYDGTPRCLCHHSRWSHDDTLTTNDADIGNCALETCDGGRICHNGGSCDGDNTCICTYHWTGDTCETPVPCPEAEDTCVNGVGCSAGCDSLECGPIDFLCECSEDFIVDVDTGTCTTRICDDGFGGEHMCMHLGTCVMNDDGTQGCECPPGISGDNCEIIDWCYEVDCSGHGLCRQYPERQRYYCECDDGWMGDDCNMQRCDDMYTCFHGARCQADGWNQGCACPEYRYDMMCESFDYCLDVDCGAHGSCEPDVEGYDYVCNCETDWRQENRQGPCINEIIHCSLPDWVEEDGSIMDYCQWGGVCTDHIEFFEYDPYYLNYTVNPDPDRPELEGEWIQPENRTIANISCTCDDDRLGQQCEIFNECSIENCTHQGTCHPNLDGTANCTCESGYSGEHCEIHTCRDLSQCHNGGQCNALSECMCEYPWSGDSCEEVDFCMFGERRFDCYHGECSSRENGFLCICDNGYILNQDTGECTTELCDEEEDTFCMNHGSCNNEYSNCTCHEEYIDHNCETYNWCWNQTCSLRGDCVNEEFDYNCSCFPGFYGRDCDLQACYDDVVCRNESLCSTTGCICAPGYRGVECDILDPCYEVDCGPGGVCVENSTLYNPRFEPPYWTADYYCEIASNRLARTWIQLNESDPHSPFDGRICGDNIANEVFCYYEGDCVRERDENRVWQWLCECQEGYYGYDCSITNPCDPDPCNGHGTCHVNSDDYSYNCTCEGTYTGEDCSMHYCPAIDSICYNGGTCPSENFDDNPCWCQYPYTGDDCSQIDYCSGVDCAQGTCLENGTCACDEGWIRDYHTGACTTSVCNRSNMFCMNNGTCSEGSYACECHDWFNYNAWNGGVDVHCEHWNYCFNETCNDRGDCINGDDGYTCSCSPGFTGEECELQMCVDGIVCQNEGLCTPSGCQCTYDYYGEDCSIYDRCGSADCGAGQCVVMPLVEEGCNLTTLAGYTMSLDTVSGVDFTFTATSSYASLGAERAIFNSGGSWSASTNDNDNEYIQLEFADPVIMHDWKTYGRADSDQWVTGYHVSWSQDGTEWHYFRDPEDFYYRYRTFEGNSDRNTPVQYSFPEPTLVKAFRIHPRDFHGHRSLRFEVHACTFVEAGYMCDCDHHLVEGGWDHEDVDDVTSPCNVQRCATIPGSTIDSAFCRNGGTCLPGDMVNHNDGVYCNCTVGWTGPFCESVDLCLTHTDAPNVPATNSPCHGHGENCTVITNWVVQTAARSVDFECECFDQEFVEYTGDRCQISQCNTTFTCQNGGSCSWDMTECECPYPYVGALCTEIDWCSTIDCQHGTCSETVDEDEIANGFECTCNTHNRWILNLETGICDTYVCADDENFCMNEGFCTAEQADASELSGTCQCTDWDFQENCQLPNECGWERNCANRGLCNRNTGICTCDGDEYSGHDCGTERCANGRRCFNGGSCRDDGERCACPWPYVGEQCEDQNWCETSDGAAVSCYRGTCESQDDGFYLPLALVTGGFNCTCDEGYQLDTTLITEEHEANCTTQICGDGSLCHNTGECVARGFGTFECNCASGYTSADCSELSSEESPSQQEDDNTGLIGGVAGAGGLALASGVGGTIYGLLRRRKRNTPEEPESEAPLEVEDLEGLESAPNSAPTMTHSYFG